MSSTSMDILWRRIAASIEDKIHSQEYQPGDRLPPERDLSRAFMVNRHTVRRALLYLQQKRLIESTQGRGSFVRRPALLYQIGRRTRFGEQIRGQESRARTETVRCGVQRATERVARALSVGLGKPVILLERIGYADELPISLSRHHFLQERVPEFLSLYERYQSITATLKACGINDYTRLRTVVSARLPTVAESERLHVPRHVPLLVTRSWNVDGQGGLIEYGEAHVAADRMELSFEGTP